jgi:hypothetical protein
MAVGSGTVVCDRKWLQGLRDMGYRLSDDELERLMHAIGGTSDSVSSSTIMASQIDWHHLQVPSLAPVLLGP